jgi:hypothetical protein
MPAVVYHADTRSEVIVKKDTKSPKLSNFSYVMAENSSKVSKTHQERKSWCEGDIFIRKNTAVSQD